MSIRVGSVSRGALARSVTVAVAASSLIASGALSVPAAGSDIRQEWIPGKEAPEIAVGLSKRLFPDGADVVYVARDDDLADALAGGSLSGGPLLYVDDGRNAGVKAEIARLKPRQIIALGGPAAVSAATLTSLGRHTTRLAGPNRYATAAAVARRAFPNKAPTAYLVNAYSFADAASTGGFTDGPILPVNPDGAVPAEITAELRRLGVSSVVAMDGVKAVPERVLTNVKKAVPQAITTRRIAGADRYETSALAAAAQFPHGAKTLYLAPARYSLAEAVAGGMATDGPVVLAMFDASTDHLKKVNLTNTSSVVTLTYAGWICARVTHEVAGHIRAQQQGTSPAPEQTPEASPNDRGPNKPSTPSTEQQSVAAFEARIFELVNIERSKAGVNPLVRDPRIDAVARGWSERMARTGEFEHSPTYQQQLREFINWGYSGENIAMGYRDADHMMTGWMNSPGHRQNILDAGYTHFGVGLARNSAGVLYGTQNFVGLVQPSEEGPAPAFPVPTTDGPEQP